MVTYIYEKPDGEIVERTFPTVPEPEKRKRIVCEDGQVAERHLGAEAKASTVKKGCYDHMWPLHSNAAGVHPSQVEEATKKFPHHQYDKEGRMVFRSKGHRRQCLKDIGMHDPKGYMH